MRFAALTALERLREGNQRFAAENRAPSMDTGEHRRAELLGGLVGRVFMAGDLGPWMYTYLREKKVPERFDARIAKYLIDDLAERLLKLERQHPSRFLVVDTRGTVGNRWQDEIHPSPKGFELLAKKVWAAIRTEVRAMERARASGPAQSL